MELGNEIADWSDNMVDGELTSCLNSVDNLIAHSTVCLLDGVLRGVHGRLLQGDACREGSSGGAARQGAGNGQGRDASDGGLREERHLG
jgi:hypothetical protein